MKHVNQFTWTKMFNDDECDDICRFMDRQQVQKGRVLDNNKGSIKQFFTRNCDLSWVPLSVDSSWFFMRIQKEVKDINDRWLQLQLDGQMEDLQYLEYGFGQFYGKHTDNSNDAVATRKLTCVLQLSDPSDYVGGNLEIDSHTYLPNGNYVKAAPKSRGMAIIFPSHLPHVARPIWWGRRKALVSWFHGKQPLR